MVAYCNQIEVCPPTRDTGDDCKARSKLSDEATRDLSGQIAGDIQQAADPKWHWQGLHAKLVDGFTFTMPDTVKNQREFPQQRGQKPGCGFPLARAVTIVSLATACVIDLTIGPYRGTQTGESALLRTMLATFGKDDVAVMDRYYCSFMMIAMLLGQGSQVCARKHHLRRSDFRRGRRLGKSR